jgi:gluconokinase
MPAAEGPLVLTLDIGTSSVRAMIWDKSGDWVKDWEAEIEHTMTVTPDGGVETDPRKLLKRTAKCIDLVLEQAGKDASAIAAVGISTFWHSLLGVDESGAPLTPLYTWADTRSHLAAEKLKLRLDETAVHARTGCMLHSSYLPAKLLWLSETQPDVFSNVRSWMSFAEYLFLKLFHTPVLSISMASGTGLLDQDSCSWDGEVIAALPIQPGELGELVDANIPVSGLRGKWAKRWPALRNVAWFPPLGDGACSNVGANCVTAARMALMIGTSGALRVLWQANQVPAPAGLWRYRLDRRRIIIGGALSDGGNLVRWLRANLTLGKSKDLLTQVGELSPDGHGLTVLPFLAGERSPGYRSDARGAFVGVGLSTTGVDIVRASLEAVSYRFGLIHELLSQVAADAGDIVVNGGAILNRPIWMQITADVLNRRLRASSEREATSRGAALMALESLQELSSIEDAPDRLADSFEPDPDRHSVYQAAMERQARLYDLILNSFSRQPILRAATQGRATPAAKAAAAQERIETENLE